VSRSARPRQLLYLVLDGLGDEPCPALDGRTPLQAARTAHLDALARDGAVFWLDMRDSDGFVSTARGMFALLGYDDDDALPRRGAVEAAGLGLALENGDVALRANWATFDEHGRIVSRRAGRIREGTTALAQAIDGLDLGDGVRALVRTGTEHRVALVLRGPGLGAAVSDSDPLHTIDEPLPPLDVEPTVQADPAAELAAGKLRTFLSKIRPILAEHPVNQQRVAQGLLPANGLLTRRAGRYVELPRLDERFGLRCVGITGDCTVAGVMRLLGCETACRPEFTANVDTDLAGKLRLALDTLGTGSDVVLVHVKAVDILSHDRRAGLEVEFLEQLDAELGQVLPRLEPHVLVAVGADHSTSITTGNHIDAPTPGLLWGPGVAASGVAGFHEAALAQAGAEVLGRGAFCRQILNLLERGRGPA
jgi:2,3-bisphosphoglycerate-independent phosphoglycerate mutase